MEQLLSGIPPAYRSYVLIGGALLLGALLGRLLAFLLLRYLRRASRRADAIAAASAHHNLARPLRTFLTVLGALIGVLAVHDGSGVHVLVERVVEIALYGVGAWLAVEAVEVFGDVLLSRYRYEGNVDNFRQRRAYTQILYVKRVVTFLAVVIAFAFVLFQFPRVRELGTGLLASAGVAGIIIGVAAQRSLANLLAGFQIAFTQPIRIDDQVIIAGEFGRVEEITLTYVVIKVWDERRLIVPLNKVIEDTFQNWSRESTSIIGHVLLYLDYGVDLDGLRAEAERLTEAHEHWDGRVKALQVTDASERTMTVRVLASAANPGNAFGLRCDLREGLLKYVRRTAPEALPKERFEGEDHGRG